MSKLDAAVEDTAVELLPCPFCGSEDIDAEGWCNSEGIRGPACNNCGASAGDVSHCNSENVTAWNTRTPPARTRELEKRLAEAERKDAAILRPTMQQLIDVGINGFALELLSESLAGKKDIKTFKRLRFAFRGVVYTLEPDAAFLSQGSGK